jgi:hypothetical protein
MPLTYASSRLAILFSLLLVGLAFTSASAQSTPPTKPEARSMKIRLIIKGQTLPTTLYDNPSARDLYSLLPLTLTLEDYAATEKITHPPRKLSTTGAPAGFTPAAGDIAYYAPWGNLALFHKGFSYSSGLVSLGRIESGVEVLRAPGKVTVVIERVE